jgi:hypothetical protein
MQSNGLKNRFARTSECSSSACRAARRHLLQKTHTSHTPTGSYPHHLICAALEFMGDCLDTDVKAFRSQTLDNRIEVTRFLRPQLHYFAGHLPDLFSLCCKSLEVNPPDSLYIIWSLETDIHMILSLVISPEQADASRHPGSDTPGVHVYRADRDILWFPPGKRDRRILIDS